MEQKRPLRILSKKWETPDTVTFELESVDGLPFLYQPGQYLSLLFQSNGKEERRAYSFSTCSGVDAIPAITVKRVVNGEFSNYLLSHVQAGDILEAIGPNGQFLLPEKRVDTLFYIVAGSGITPVMSHLKKLLDSKPEKANPVPGKIVLYYANRDSAHTIFKAQIDRWIAEHPQRFECVYFFSREKNAEHALFRYLNNGLLEQQIHAHFQGNITPQQRRNIWFYLCAPTAMMRMARMTLRTLNFPDDHIRQETFQSDLRLPERQVDRSITHTIIAQGLHERIEFQTFEGETILDAALRQGIPLPYTCKSGVCLTCLAKCTAGIVDVAFAATTRREGPGSMVNTCIGYAVSERVELVYGV